jgi:uncharacterized protein (TIGR03435 family)
MALWAGTDITGAWSGTLFSITFKQEGSKLSGSGGPDPREQYAFTGTVDGDHILFKVGSFDFDLRAIGEELKGEMKAGDHTMEVSLKRVEALKNRVAPTAFEVASIKPNVSGSRGSSTHSAPGGEIIMENISLKQVVMMAYDVRNFTFSGPDWMDTVRFDIVAKPPSPVNRDEMKILIRSLLAERFKLVVHRETKTLSAYELVVAKGGLKIKEVEPGPGGANSNTNGGKAILNAQRVTMARFADLLGTRLDRPVVDKTDVPGAFDIKVEWTVDQNASEDSDPPAGPTIFTALQEQIGLRLAAQKLPVEIVVVDRVEKLPTEN